MSTEKPPTTKTFEYRVISLKPDQNASKWTDILNGEESAEQGADKLEGDWEIVTTAEAPEKGYGGAFTGQQEVRVIMKRRVSQ